MEPLTDKAVSEARRLGFHWVGLEHLLLALATEPPGTPARDALGSCDVNEGDVATVLAEIKSAPRLPPSGGGILLSPTLLGIEGFAKGFAIAHGRRHPRPEDFLLALSWEPCGGHTRALLALSITSAMLQRALADAGVVVPALEPPPFQEECDYGDAVDVSADELPVLLNMLEPLLWPPEITVKVKRNGDRASVLAAKRIDLAGELKYMRSQA
jgi:hypothetical protein